MSVRTQTTLSAAIALLCFTCPPTANAGPDCTPQPLDESGNGCADAVVIDLDANGGTYTWTGDNSDATNGTCNTSGLPCRMSAAPGEDCAIDDTCIFDGDCTEFGNDPLEWIAFSIDNNSTCEIDYCCTDPNSGAGDIRYVIVQDACPLPDNSECGSSTFRDGECPTPCADNNVCDAYALTTGTWYYPVSSVRHCDGGTNECITDEDCGGTPGTCIDNTGTYQLHVTCTPLPPVNCCLENICVFDLDEVDCAEQGGFSEVDCFLPPPSPCELGRCCIPADGTCEDNDGAGISLTECLDIEGTYTGGARCDSNPCPICPGNAPENCQYDTGQFIVANDRALWSPGNPDRWVDDFRATDTGPLDQLCYWPAFFNPVMGIECSASDETPVDDFELRLFSDDDGLPGAEIGAQQSLDVAYKASLGGSSRVWIYSFNVPTPPLLAAGECYWLEVSGSGAGQGGCTTYATLSADGNHAVINDQNETFEMNDYVFSLGNPPNTDVDIAFCVGNGMDSNGCGNVTGGCCIPLQGCLQDVTAQECIAANGIFTPATACNPGLCNPDPAYCYCDESRQLDAPGEAGELGLPFAVEFENCFCGTDNVTTACDINAGDRGQNGTTPIGNAVWSKYTLKEGECGELTISTCDEGFDGALAAWINYCPTDETQPVACGDDTCGIGGGMAVITLDVNEGQTVFAKMGGYLGDCGNGTMSWSLVVPPEGCPESPEPPLADDRYDVQGNSRACNVDDDCEGLAVCRDDLCYVPTNRMLGLQPNPANQGNWTYRVSLNTGAAGNVVLGYTGLEVAVDSNGPGPTNYLLARLVDASSASYIDWNAVAEADGEGYVMINDCEIAPDHEYVVQAIIEGADIAVEFNYSAPLGLPTAPFGDATGGGIVGTPPDGAANLIDVFATVQAFQNTQAAPKHWYELAPVDGSNFPVIALADTFIFVSAFQGSPFAGDGPTNCP